MDTQVFLSFTISKDESEHCSLSYRRIPLSTKQAEKLVEFIYSLTPTQVKTLKQAFDAIFNNEEIKPEITKSNNKNTKPTPDNDLINSLFEFV